MRTSDRLNPCISSFRKGNCAAIPNPVATIRTFPYSPMGAPEQCGPLKKTMRSSDDPELPRGFLASPKGLLSISSSVGLDVHFSYSGARSTSFRVKPSLGSIKKFRLGFSPSLQDAIVKGWLCKKDHRPTDGIQTLTCCPALIFHGRGEKIVILTAPCCLAIKALEQPRRKLKFLYRTAKHCITSVIRKVPPEASRYARGTFELDGTCLHRA